MGYANEHEFNEMDREYGRIEDRRTTGRCPVHNCLMIIGRNGEVFKQAICPSCMEASAPEMLAALEAMVGDNDSLTFSERMERALPIARAAINKAKGGL